MSTRRNMAFTRGFRDGLRGVLAVGRYDTHRPYVRVRLGTPRDDARLRALDAERVAADLHQRQPVG